MAAFDFEQQCAVGSAGKATQARGGNSEIGGKMKQCPMLLQPDRLRTMERPFGWIPFRILSSGLLGQLSPSAKLLFFFLCLVADRRGVSFYGSRRILDQLGLEPSQLVDAVGELRHADVLAYDGQVYQLLSLPPWLGQTPNGGAKPSKPASRQEPSPRRGQQHIGQLLDDIMEEG